MVLRILSIMFVCAIVILIAMWFLNGGLSKGLSFAKGLPDVKALLSGSTTVGTFRLPYQPDNSAWGSTYQPGQTGTDIRDTAAGSQSSAERLNELQNQYDDLKGQSLTSEKFGPPSPHKGDVIFGDVNVKDGDPQFETITIQGQFGQSNKSDDRVSLRGWSLYSVATNRAFPLPGAADPLITGAMNSLVAVTLGGGELATIVSGSSPVVVSFRENECSGYLSAVKEFSPPLGASCPLPTDELPITPSNLRAYGDTCFDLIKSLQPCSNQGDATVNVTPACRSKVDSLFSYNGCVNEHRLDTSFKIASWRLYLNQQAGIWNDTHDIIRLRDEKGLTVDAYTY